MFRGTFRSNQRASVSKPRTSGGSNYHKHQQRAFSQAAPVTSKINWKIVGGLAIGFFGSNYLSGLVKGDDEKKEEETEVHVQEEPTPKIEENEIKKEDQQPEPQVTDKPNEPTPTPETVPKPVEITNETTTIAPTTTTPSDETPTITETRPTKSRKQPEKKKKEDDNYQQFRMLLRLEEERFNSILQDALSQQEKHYQKQVETYQKQMEEQFQQELARLHTQMTEDFDTQYTKKFQEKEMEVEKHFLSELKKNNDTRAEKLAEIGKDLGIHSAIVNSVKHQLHYSVHLLKLQNAYKSLVSTRDSDPTPALDEIDQLLQSPPLQQIELTNSKSLITTSVNAFRNNLKAELNDPSLRFNANADLHILLKTNLSTIAKPTKNATELTFPNLSANAQGALMRAQYFSEKGEWKKAVQEVEDAMKESSTVSRAVRPWHSKMTHQLSYGVALKMMEAEIQYLTQSFVGQLKK